MVSLIDMTEVPMKTILEKLGYVEIQCLRKTCHSLRNFIDYFRPEQSIDVMEISGTAGIIHLLIYQNDDSKLYPNGQKIHVEYQALDGENAEITWFRKNKYLKKTILHENFSEVLSRDFGLILDCKLPILRKFSIDFKYTIMAGIQNFEHFSYLVVKFDVLYLKDALYLKELFLHTPSTSKQYRINFRNLSDRDAFIREFGHPITEQRETLIFERPDDKEHVVTIGFFPKFFEFNIVKKCGVPNDVEVVN
ncbi:unnamed protein product [Caenorhabditis brenneri]